MPSSDNDLLARLHALKPSSISLDTTPSIRLDDEVRQPQSTEDKLAARLKALRAGISQSDPAADARVDRETDLTAKVKDALAVEPDPARDWAHLDADDQSLEDLLAELDEHAKRSTNEPDTAQSLLKEARAALSELGKDNAVSDHHEHHVQQADASEPGHTDHQGDDDHDEEDANEYVNKVLAEVEVEAKYGHSELEDQQTGDGSVEHSTLNLPSTPSALHQASPEPPTYEDSELEARFSKLGLDLPSTPTTAPSSKKPNVSTPKPNNKAGLLKYTDDDIGSWCCICNEDGEIKCKGCDDDIYCQQCWREGHGNGPGQERGHKAVQFVRKGGGMAV